MQMKFSRYLVSNDPRLGKTDVAVATLNGEYMGTFANWDGARAFITERETAHTICVCPPCQSARRL